MVYIGICARNIGVHPDRVQIQSNNATKKELKQARVIKKKLEKIQSKLASKARIHEMEVEMATKNKKKDIIDSALAYFRDVAISDAPSTLNNEESNLTST